MGYVLLGSWSLPPNVFVSTWPLVPNENPSIDDNFPRQYSNRNSSVEKISQTSAFCIFTGKAKGEGPFAIFGGTLKFILDLQYVDILSNIDGRKSSFSVPGIIDVQVENFVNPVTGEEQNTKIQLPKGFIFKLADAAKTKVMKILTPNLNFDDSGKNAYYCVVEFRGP
jgi:hypothetical protein